MSTISVVAVTGGPCAGKSTGMAFLKQKLEELGCMVILTPEAPTELMLRGMTPKLAPTNFFQRAVGERMLFDLEQAKRFGRAYLRERPMQPVVILCDRGIADIRAYTPEGEYERLLDHWDLGDHETMKHELYHAVVHMVTAADGASEHYSLSNNPARLEGAIDEAIAVDERTRKAWIGHPHFFVVDNSTSFERKLKRVLAHICNAIGVPTPLEIERKYLVRAWDKSAFDRIEARVEIDIHQAYLPTSVGEERVRARSIGGSSSYFHAMKFPTEGKHRVEYERLITKAEFDRLVTRHALAKKFLSKRRHAFVANGKHFELDVFASGRTSILECELSSWDDPVRTPPFVDIEREVTDDPAFSNHAIWLEEFS